MSMIHIFSSQKQTQVNIKLMQADPWCAVDLFVYLQVKVLYTGPCSIPVNTLCDHASASGQLQSVLSETVLVPY